MIIFTVETKMFILQKLKVDWRLPEIKELEHRDDKHYFKNTINYIKYNKI